MDYFSIHSKMLRNKCSIGAVPSIMATLVPPNIVPNLCVCVWGGIFFCGLSFFFFKFICLFLEREREENEWGSSEKRGQRI